MATFQRIAAAAMTALFLILSAARSDPDTTLVSKICSLATFAPSSYYRYNNEQVIQCLIDSARGRFRFRPFTVRPPGITTVVMAMRRAMGWALSHPDRRGCLYDISTSNREGCGNSIGAQIQFKDCRMRYEHYPFTENSHIYFFVKSSELSSYPNIYAHMGTAMSPL